MKQYRLRFNLDNEMDKRAYDNLMQHTVDCNYRDFICGLISQEYQRQLIINTIKDDIEQYKRECDESGK